MPDSARAISLIATMPDRMKRHAKRRLRMFYATRALLIKRC